MIYPNCEKKREAPSLSFGDFTGGLGDDGWDAPNPVGIVLKISEFQLESVAQLFDNTSRKWVADFVEEIDKMDFNINQINFDDPNAIIKAVDAEVEQMWEVEGANTARTLLIDGLREVSGTIDIALDAKDKTEKVISVLKLGKEIKQEYREHLDDWKDYRSQMKEMKSYVDFWQKGGIVIQYDQDKYNQLLKIAPPTIRNKLIEAWKGGSLLEKSQLINNIVSNALEAGEIVETLAEMFEQQEKMVKFLSKSRNHKDIAKMVIQQKIITKLVAEGKIPPEKLARMNTYDPSYGFLNLSINLSITQLGK